MERYEENTVQILFLIVACLLIWLVGTYASPADISPMQSAMESIGPHLLIDPLTNSLVTWRLDPVLMTITSLFQGDYRTSAFPGFWLHLLVFFFGILILFIKTSRGKDSANWYAWFAAIFLVFFCPPDFGQNRIILGSLCWFPWFVLALRQAFSTRENKWSLLSICFAICLANAANQLAPLMVISGVCCAYGLGRQDDAPGLSMKRKSLLVAFCLIPAIYAMLIMPAPTFPEYPALARVVPDDGIPGIIRPLVGPDAPIQVSDREPLRQGLTKPALLLLFLFSIYWSACCSKPGWLTRYMPAEHKEHFPDSPTKSPLLQFACLLALLTALDCLFPEGISQIAPLATLSRVIPGVFYFQLAPLSLILSVLCCVLWTYELPNKSLARSSLLCFLLPLSNISNYTHSTPSPQFIQNKLENSPSLARLILSPSLAVLRSEGFWIANGLPPASSLRAIPAATFNTRLAASSSTADTDTTALLDARKDTRWSTGGGRQQGNEWLALHFDIPQRIRGLILSTGAFKSDYPRGLRISGFKNCQPEAKRPSKTKVIRNIPAWQGPVEFTDEGYPYYGPQSSVRVYFEKEVKTCGLLIEQTGKDEHFDWSVTLIKLLVEEAGAVKPAAPSGSPLLPVSAY